MTDVKIINDASGPLTIDPDDVQAYDAEGNPLPRYFDSSQAHCQEHPGDLRVQIARGETCAISIYWLVRPDPKLLGRVRLVIAGLTRGSESRPVEVLLEKAP
jgi:hypothetical protein